MVAAIAKRVGLACASVALALLLAEGVLRLLPVNEGLRVQAVNAASPVRHFEPGRASTWSQGAGFTLVNEVRTNNEGFVNDQDYESGSSSPLLAVVGDSYVEAAMVPFGETVHGRLASSLAAKCRVYSYGASGSGLAQYLAFARYARDRHAPDAFVFVVVANDFADSLTREGDRPGFHYFERRPDGQAELVRRDYAPSALRNVVRRSALAMYLLTNVEVQHLFRPRHGEEAQDLFVGNAPAEVPEETLAEYRWVAERFLELLPESTGVAAERILLVFDGMRPHVYDDEWLPVAEASAWGRMRRTMIERAADLGLRTADLNPVFLERSRRTGERFEHETDAHWNGKGHAVAAEAVLDSGVLDDVLAEGERGAGDGGGT